jgi:hypothetical protein
MDVIGDIIAEYKKRRLREKDVGGDEIPECKDGECECYEDVCSDAIAE